MVLRGQLIASTNKVVWESRHLDKERERTQPTTIMPAELCVQSCFSQSVKWDRNLVFCLHENGLTLRVHGNSHTQPKHSLSFQSIKYVVRFLLTYSELLPSPSRTNPWLQQVRHEAPPLKCIKAMNMDGVYQSAAEYRETIRRVAYTTFCWLWRSLLPSIIMKPMSDLCWTCQQTAQPSFVLPTVQKGTSQKTSRQLRSTSGLCK